MRSWMTAAGLILYPLQVVCLTPKALVPDIKQAVEDLYPSRSGLLPPSPQHHETLNSFAFLSLGRMAERTRA